MVRILCKNAGGSGDGNGCAFSEVFYGFRPYCGTLFRSLLCLFPQGLGSLTVCSTWFNEVETLWVSAKLNRSLSMEGRFPLRGST